MEKSVYKVVKSKVNNDEKRAIAGAVKKLNCTEDQLTANHSKGMFVFELKNSTTPTDNTGKVCRLPGHKFVKGTKGKEQVKI
ncbi:hypothetical protein [Flavobacterium capsici]|uniref:Uncharacterized protein n=1 Tax=Flavobacterium capsici TaxID=3075618 RepID=A0AA96EY50_9FLAO|nr:MULTISPECIES: hypothetical protein [unclassified Flavobacterium]WNM19290.1 hypothetical protein RN608_01075 [Flavobacterium sp. PMR2A8]WNM20679.1 hypothetical protein RN605_08245 [Flavobacterium sp. PMTSA4]